MRLAAVLVLLMLALAQVHGAVVTKVTSRRFSSGDIVQLGKAEFSDKVVVKNGDNITSTQRVKVTVPLQIGCVYVNDMPVKKQIVLKKRITVDVYARYGYGECSVTVDGVKKTYTTTSGTISSVCNRAAQALGMKFSAELGNQLKDAFGTLSVYYLNNFNSRNLWNYGVKTWKTIKPIYKKSYFYLSRLGLGGSSAIRIHYVFDRQFRYYEVTNHEYLVPDGTYIEVGENIFSKSGLSCSQVLSDRDVQNAIKEALKSKLRTISSGSYKLSGNYLQTIEGVRTQMQIFEHQYRNYLNTTLQRDPACLSNFYCIAKTLRKAYSILTPLRWLYGTDSCSVFVYPEYTGVVLKVPVSDY